MSVSISIDFPTNISTQISICNSNPIDVASVIAVVAHATSDIADVFDESIDISIFGSIC